MRRRINKQLKIVEHKIHHMHALELLFIRKIISENIQLLDLITADLIKGLKNPEKGREGMMSSEQVFMALVIKQMNGFSYEQLAFHLEDSKTYRRFCGFGIADDAPSKSTLQRDIKKISATTLEGINKIIINYAKDSGIENGKTVRVDCTVVESNIHHPTDSSLLYDVVKVLARLIDVIKDDFLLEIKFINHTRSAKKKALKILNSRGAENKKLVYKKLIRATEKTVSYAVDAVESLKIINFIAPNLEAIAAAEELCHFIELGKSVIFQTKSRVLDGMPVPSSQKVVSIFEPHTDIIVKDKRETYYGHKIALTGGKSGLLTDLVILEGNPADTNIAKEMIVRQKKVFDKYPAQATFDGGFASKDNLKEIKELGLKDIVFAKKRGLEISDMAKSTWVYKKLRDFRAGIEGMISFLKRSFGLSRCTWKGFDSFKAYAWSSVITANLLLMSRHFISVGS